MAIRINRAAENERSRQESITHFLARKAEFDALLAELTTASAEHFGNDPEGFLWAAAAEMVDATAKLKDIADSLLCRGEYAPGA